MKELETLFLDELREIYDGEHQLVQGLAEWAQNPKAGRHDTPKQTEEAAALGKELAFGG